MATISFDRAAAFFDSFPVQHCLNFFPLPHGQGSFRRGVVGFIAQYFILPWAELPLPTFPGSPDYLPGHRSRSSKSLGHRLPVTTERQRKRENMAGDGRPSGRHFGMVFWGTSRVNQSMTNYGTILDLPILFHSEVQAMKRALRFALLSSVGLMMTGAFQAQQRRADAIVPIFNTVKQKLAEGKQVVGGTVTTADPDIYCAMANSGFDFLWIEMQHSPLNYTDAARMIWACRDAPAIPFIRVPNATEGDIQKATDIGALGIIVPMVDSVQNIERAIHRGQYGVQS